MPIQDLITGTTTTQLNREYMTRSAWQAGVIGSINVLVLILSAKMIVLVAVLGGIYLTMIALAQPDPWRLASLAAYGLMVCVPVVWLASRR